MENATAVVFPQITDEDLKGFLKTAQEEQDPYYKQIFSRTQEDFERTLKFQADEREAQLAQEQSDEQLAREQTAATAAEQGVATSGIRTKAEARLAERARNIAESSRRKFAFDIGTYTRGVEDILGSERLMKTTLPAIVGRPITAIASGVRGSLEREQTTAAQARANELQDLERKRRAELLALQGNVSTL